MSDPATSPRSSLKRKRTSPPVGSAAREDQAVDHGPSALKSNPDEVNLSDSSDDDDYGPAAPRRQLSAKPDQPGSSPRKRVLGPSLPPGRAQHTEDAAPSHTRPRSPSSSSDDDYGPALPSASDGVLVTALSEERLPSATNDDPHNPSKDDNSGQPQRAEWMLAPPTSTDWTRRIDPTKLKSRKFAASGSRAATASSAHQTGAGIASAWTETPEEKRRRLEDQVLGRGGDDDGDQAQRSGRTHATSRDPDGGSATTAAQQRQRKEAEDRATRRRIEEYNAQNRGARSLLETHAAAKQAGVAGSPPLPPSSGARSADAGRGSGKREDAKAGEPQQEQDDDPSRRAFDREKDMALGGRIGHAQRRDLLTQARGFGGRFQGGSYL